MIVPHTAATTSDNRIVHVAGCMGEIQAPIFLRAFALRRGCLGKMGLRAGIHSEETGQDEERTEMARETDSARLPGGGEARVIECPECSSVMTRMEAEGVSVDVCAGGCGGI